MQNSQISKRKKKETDLFAKKRKRQNVSVKEKRGDWQAYFEKAHKLHTLPQGPNLVHIIPQPFFRR